LHADFVVEFDRRHASRTTEAAGYNQWIAAKLAELLATTVAPKLASLYPGQTVILNALAPQGVAEGIGQHVLTAYNRAMALALFVPCRDGQTRAPGDTFLLPKDSPQYALRDEILTSGFFDRLLINDGQMLSNAASWLHDPLGADLLSITRVLENLEDPAEAYWALWDWLVRWHDSKTWYEQTNFERALGDARCIRTTAGGWVAPASGVFFPRHIAPDAPDIDIPIETAVVPEANRASELMKAAGIREFAWQELLKEHVLPALTSDDTASEARRDMHAILRRYFESGERPDATITSRLGDVRLAVRNAGAFGTSVGLAPGKTVYFGMEWTDSADLEVLYSPFERAEFLAEECPEDQRERHALRDYYGRLQVTSSPRMTFLDQRNVSQATRPLLHSWQHTEQYQAALNCGKGHTEQMQMLRVGRLPDRMADVIAEGDIDRLCILVRFLAKGWATREGRTEGYIECRHSQHKRDNRRPLPSLMRHVLLNTKWLPAEFQGVTSARSSNDVWCSLPTSLGSAAACVPRLEAKLNVSDIVAMAKDLGAVDGKRPLAADLAKLLRLLRDELDGGHPIAARTAIIEAGRWATYQLNRSLEQDPDSQTNPLEGPVPLLATRNGELLFTDRPYTVSDPNLEAAWAADMAVVEGTASVALIRRLGLQSLDEVADVEPCLIGPRPELDALIVRDINAAAHFIAVLAIDVLPALEGEIIAKLRELEVSAGHSLTLISRIDGELREFADVASHIQLHNEPEGIESQATAFFGVPHGMENPDWISFGHQLAAHLGEPRLGDAIALLLGADEPGRHRYFQSRRIDGFRLSEFEASITRSAPAEQPGQDWPEPVSHSEPQPLIGREVSAAAREVDGDENPEASGLLLDGPQQLLIPLPRPNGSTKVSFDTGESDRDRTLPPITPRGLVIRSVESSQVAPRRRAERQARPDMPLTPADRDRIANNARENGRRGEQFAYDQERERVLGLGMDPAVVDWVSSRDESADHDLESVDEDGVKIFIEVKSTESARIGTPVELTVKEWQAAARHRDRFLIYRVLEVVSSEPQLLVFRDPFGLVESGKAILDPSRYHLTLG